MSVINPLVEGPYTFYAKCPKCKSTTEIQVFKTAISVAIKCIQYNRKYTAICTGCKTKYEITNEEGDNLLLGKGALILKE